MTAPARPVRERAQAELRVIVLHGAHGGPDTNWFPWLHRELAQAGIGVVRPHFPTPQGQSLDAWLGAYDRVVTPLPPAQTVLVGHSLGAAMALRLVERAAEPFGGLYLAAAFVGALGLPEYDPINASFFATPFDWPRIRGRAGRVCRCWAGDDDPYVPLARSQDVARALNAALDVIRGGGHLNGEAGFTSFPQLRDAIIAAAAAEPALP